jgi:signal peptidase II
MKKFRHLIYLVLLVAFDQFTKYLAVTKLLNQKPIQLIPKVLQLQYLENTGAVWGVFGSKTNLLALVSIIIMIGMIYFYFKIPKEKHYNCLRIIIIFITAGAIGNLIDRIVRTFVVDFIYFEIIDFPIFNIADSYVTVSATLLIILFLFYYKDEDFEFLNFKKVKSTGTTKSTDTTESTGTIESIGTTESIGTMESTDAADIADAADLNASTNLTDSTDSNEIKGEKKDE